jgi:hypothetical protein
MRMQRDGEEGGSFSAEMQACPEEEPDPRRTVTGESCPSGCMGETVDESEGSLGVPTAEG